MNAADCVKNAVLTALIEEMTAATDAAPPAIAGLHDPRSGDDETGPADVHWAWATAPESSVSASATTPGIRLVLTPYFDTFSPKTALYATGVTRIIAPRPPTYATNKFDRLRKSLHQSRNLNRVNTHASYAALDRHERLGGDAAHNISAH